MTLFPSRELRSVTFRCARFAVFLIFGAGTSGCYIANQANVLPPEGDTIVESVDANMQMSVTPGQVAGVFVEYGSGGAWHVYTSCDTNLSNQPCSYDILLSVDTGAIANPVGENFEPVDMLTQEGSSTLHLVTGTATKLDGVSFLADPGTMLTVDVLLDGIAQPQYLNWVSGGKHRQGTLDLTNPTGFLPASP